MQKVSRATKALAVEVDRILPDAFVHPIYFHDGRKISGIEDAIARLILEVMQEFNMTKCTISLDANRVQKQFHRGDNKVGTLFLHLQGYSKTIKEQIENRLKGHLEGKEFPFSIQFYQIIVQDQDVQGKLGWPTYALGFHFPFTSVYREL